MLKLQRKELGFRLEYYQLGTERVSGLKVYRLKMKARI